MCNCIGLGCYGDANGETNAESHQQVQQTFTGMTKRKKQQRGFEKGMITLQPATPCWRLNQPPGHQLQALHPRCSMPVHLSSVFHPSIHCLPLIWGQVAGAAA
ncbi:hypothetical protein ATANTOWER_018361 [Ataeniobius toweri]|uniref:Uncharacterized protein n=1 Tax=Ataeniobius toweri TaxID=208326 RepID=A0ABU7BIY1_9TELE|nr:hypothetical protein [Ataeniobius toweri]